MTPLIPLAATGLLLTAGRGSRLGGCCKGLLQIDGQPLVVRQLRTMADAGIRRAVVVIGAQADAISQALSRHAAALSDIEITRVGAPWRRRIRPWASSVASACRKVCRLTS